MCLEEDWEVCLEEDWEAFPAEGLPAGNQAAETEGMAEVQAETEGMAGTAEQEAVAATAEAGG